MIKLFLVLILGFGPHVLVADNNSNLQIRQRHLVLLQQGLQKIDYQQSYGIIPRSVAPLISNQPREDEAPIFAGANELLSQDGNTDRFAARQKKKPAGYISWRMEVIPHAVKFSGAVKSAPQPVSHAT